MDKPVVNILVTLDANYIRPLKVLLKSLFVHNEGQIFHFYLIHDEIDDNEIYHLQKFCEKYHSTLFDIKIDETAFAGAPVLMHYSKAMYYRLLAHELLPQHLNKILYIDPDVICLNDIHRLYSFDIDHFLFAAAPHAGMARLAEPLNTIRLQIRRPNAYYNSGVLLMNLEKMRRLVSREEIFNYIENNKNIIMFPDQDVLNALYQNDIWEIEDAYYNFDASSYPFYKLELKHNITKEWIIDNTVLLHFCGPSKPWKKSGQNGLDYLYFYYEKRLLIEDFVQDNIGMKTAQSIGEKNNL